MCCSNVGAKFKSQYLSHVVPNSGGFFLFFSFSLGQVVHNLTIWIWKKT